MRIWKSPLSNQHRSQHILKKTRLRPMKNKILFKKKRKSQSKNQMMRNKHEQFKKVSNHNNQNLLRVRTNAKLAMKLTNLLMLLHLF